MHVGVYTSARAMEQTQIQSVQGIEFLEKGQCSWSPTNCDLYRKKKEAQNDFLTG